MAFDDETTDVLIGGYLSKDAAKDDYEAVLGSGGYLHGAVVVSKDLEGNLSVEQTDHMVREGAAGLILAYPHSATGKVEPAVTRATKKVVGEAEGHHVQALKGAIADAQQKMTNNGT
jgi:hypothetical protein